MRNVGKIRVGHVTLGLDVGGLETLLLEFARHADRDRFELSFISLTTDGPLAASIEETGWRVIALAKQPGVKPALVMQLRRLFKQLRLDVLHTHDEAPLVYGGAASMYAGLKAFVHTQHHGALSGVSTRQEWLMGLLSRATDRFVCVSRDSARQMRRQGAPDRKLQVILNGVDLDRFGYAQPVSDGPVLTVGRLSPEKDQATLIRAAAIAVNADPSFQLQIAGDGVCRAALEQQIAALGLQDRVRLLGQIDAVAELYGSASLFVLPSLSEGVSLTLIEAMARGRPVVATRVGGNPEVVADGETGLLVPANDPKAMAAAMLRARGDIAMGVNGRRRVEQSFDVRKMVRTYEQLYCEIGGRG